MKFGRWIFLKRCLPTYSMFMLSTVLASAATHPPSEAPAPPKSGNEAEDNSTLQKLEKYVPQHPVKFKKAPPDGAIWRQNQPKKSETVTPDPA